jgi:hypothetical protein
MQLQSPLVYFHGVRPGKYLPAFPAYRSSCPTRATSGPTRGFSKSATRSLGRPEAWGFAPQRMELFGPAIVFYI